MYGETIEVAAAGHVDVFVARRLSACVRYYGEHDFLVHTVNLHHFCREPSSLGNVLRVLQLAVLDGVFI